VQAEGEKKKGRGEETLTVKAQGKGRGKRRGGKSMWGVRRAGAWVVNQRKVGKGERNSLGRGQPPNKI